MKVEKMTDCPKCAIKYKTNQNKAGYRKGRPIGCVVVNFIGWRGKRIFVIDVCDLCGGSGRVFLSRAFPSSSRQKAELMKLYKKQKIDMKAWNDLGKEVLGNVC